MHFSVLIIKIFTIFTLSLFLVACSGGSNESNNTPSQAISTAIILPSEDVNISVQVQNECGDAGGFALYTGFDTNNNNMLDESEYSTNAQIICHGTDGADGQDGSNGTNGINGSDGTTSLIKTTAIVAGDVDCTYGGVLVETGLDDGSGSATANNNILEDDEVLNSQKVCNGTDITDTTAPSVNSYTPTTGSISSEYNITLTFSEAMDSSTITPSSILLHNGSNYIAGSVSYDDTLNKATFTPFQELEREQEHFILASTLLKDKAGNAMTTTTSHSFTLPTYLFDETKLGASDASSGDALGRSISISANGDTILVGADGVGVVGAAYIYQYDGSSWSETKITASDADSGNFGHSVDISADGTRAIVSDYLDDDSGENSGSVYIYSYDGSSWNETKILASDPQAEDEFGKSVGISADGNSVIVGAYRSDDHGTQSGSAYVYRYTGYVWNETKFTASDAAQNDFYGFSVGISADGNTVIIGAYQDDDGGQAESGSAYIYSFDGSSWEEEKLTTSSMAYDSFGYKVDISADGNTVIVGAYREDGGVNDSGAVYIYTNDGSSWNETKLKASDAGGSDYLGWSVSISADGNTAIAGATGVDDKGSNSGSAYIFTKDGSSWSETKLLASDGEAGDILGGSVSLSADGNIAVIGARGDDDGGSGSGSTYIFKDAHRITTTPPKFLYYNATSSSVTLNFNKALDPYSVDNSSLHFGDGERLIDGFVSLSEDNHSLTFDVKRVLSNIPEYNLHLSAQIADSYGNNLQAQTLQSKLSNLSGKLLASDPGSGDYFGSSVSISADGNRAIVGAPYDGAMGPSSGSAYIFSYDGSSWSETKLTASDAFQDDYFGYRVNISSDGNTAIVGTFGASNEGDSSGSAYIYRYNGSSWDETKLRASDPAAGDYFGSSVSISADGNRAIVGAFYDDDGGTDSGSAYIFSYDGSSWSETKLTASDPAAYDYFGTSVSISADGNTVIVGAYGDDDGGSGSGSAYIYRYDGSSWNQTKLTASDATTNDYFGYSVSVSADGNTAIIGAHQDSTYGYVSGSAYIFTYNNLSWNETKLTASDAAQHDYFGKSVSISANGMSAIVGSLNDDPIASGSAYIFTYNASSWSETKLIASDVTFYKKFGSSVSISADGNTAIVGAIGDNDGRPSGGSAYIIK